MALSLFQLRKLIHPYKGGGPSDNFRILDQWAEYDETSDMDPRERNLDFLCYRLMTVDPETGKRTTFYKAVRFARVERLPADAKQSTAFMDMQEQVLSAVWEKGSNLITIVANVIRPEPLGLLYLYGIQCTSADSIEDAKAQCRLEFAAFVAAMQGTFAVLEMRCIKAKESEWLLEKMYGMDRVTVIRGIPKFNKAGVNAGNKGIGNTNINPDSQGTLEELIIGMADYEYILEVLSTPVYRDTMERWHASNARQMTEWTSRLQGTKSLSMNLSIPIMYMTNVGQSLGTSKALTNSTSTGHARSESYSQSQGQSVGQSLSQSYGRTYGMTSGHTLSNSYSRGISHTRGVSFGESFGTNQSLSHNVGQSVGQSVGTSQSVSQNVSQSSSQGINISTGINQGHSLNSSTGLSQGMNTSNSIGQSQGTSYNVSQGRNNSLSHSLGTSQNFGFSQNQSVSVGNSASVGQSASSSMSRGISESFGSSRGVNSSTSMSVGRSSNWGQSSSSSWNAGKSTNTGGNFSASISPAGVGLSGGINNSSGVTHSYGGSDSVTASHGISASASKSMGMSAGISHSMGASASSSVSRGVSTSQSASRSASMGYGQSAGYGASEGYSSSVGSSLSQGWGANSSSSRSVSVGNSLGRSQSAGEGYNTGVSQSIGTSYSTSKSVGYGQSFGVNQSRSVSQSESYGESFGVSRSQNYSKSESYGESESIGKTYGQSFSESASESSSTGYGQNYGETRSVSNGQGYTENSGTSSGISSGTSAGTSLGTSASMGLGPSIGYNKSHQWMDQEVKDLLEVMEYENQRLKAGLRIGSFFTYVYLAAQNEEALAAAQAVAKATWSNEYALAHPVQVLDLTKTEQDHLLYKFNAFSTDITKEYVYGLLQYRYCTVLNADEYVAYTHLPRVSEGGIDVIVQDIPKFAVPGSMKGEIYMGNILNPERYTFKNGYRTQHDYRFPEEAIMHGIITGASRSGKTVCAMRFIRELSKVRRKATGKRMRIVVMDPKHDWRGLVRYIEPERFNFYSMGNTHFRPIHLNVWKVPKGVPPQQWIDGIIDIYCRAYGFLERGKQMIADVVYELYQEAGVFDVADSDGWEEKVPELSSQVCFTAIYKRFAQKKVAMEDPANKLAKGGNDTRDAFARILERLSCFNRDFSVETRLYGLSTGISIDEMIGDDDVTVLESEGLENTFQNFIFGAVTSGFYKYAKYHEGGFLADDQYETILVIEEANQVLIGNDKAKGDTVSLPGQSEFELILDQSAGYGLFIVAITQKIADMPRSVIANSGMVFAGRQSTPDDINVIVRKVGREERIDDRDLVKWFPRASTGWFVCQSSRSFSFKQMEPVLVAIAPLNAKTPTNEELSAYLEEKKARAIINGHR